MSALRPLRQLASPCPRRATASKGMKMRSILRKLSIAALAFGLTPSPAGAQVPQMLPYNGFLADSANSPVDGTINLTVRIYEGSDSPNSVWQETLQNVPVDAGYFRVDLGQIVPLSQDVQAGRTRYIGLSVNGDAEATPRQRIGSVPYALMANDSLMLGGQPAEIYVTIDRLNQEIGGRGYVTEARVRELIAQLGGGGEGGGLDAAAVNALIDARGYLSEVRIRELIALLAGEGNEGGLNAAQVNALIDARGYLSEEAINALISGRGYLSEEAINALISGRGYLNEAAINALIDARGYVTEARVNQLIDARGYVTEERVNQLIDARAQVLVDAAIDALRVELRQEIAQAAGASAYILGVSAQTSNGRLSFGGVTGLRAANAMCQATFANEPTAHLCGYDEVQRALSDNAYNRNNNFSGVNTWSNAPLERGAFNGSKRNTCQNLLYNSGDAATGTQLTVRLNDTSDGGGGGIQGHTMEALAGRNCGNNIPVLCCR